MSGVQVRCGRFRGYAIKGGGGSGGKDSFSKCLSGPLAYLSEAPGGAACTCTSRIARWRSRSPAVTLRAALYEAATQVPRAIHRSVDVADHLIEYNKAGRAVRLGR